MVFGQLKHYFYSYLILSGSKEWAYSCLLISTTCGRMCISKLRKLALQKHATTCVVLFWVFTHTGKVPFVYIKENNTEKQWTFAVNIIWYFLQLNLYFFMVIYTTRFRKLFCLKRICCLIYNNFLLGVAKRKTEFSKITHMFWGILSIYRNIITFKILALQFVEYWRLGNAISSFLGPSNLKIFPTVQTKVAKIRERSYVI